MAGLVFLGMLGVALGQFILMRGYGVRRTLLFLQTFILCALIGVALAFVLIMVLLGTMASGGLLLLAIALGLIIGGVCGWLALQYERLIVIINLVLYMLALIVILTILTAMTGGLVWLLIIALAALLVFMVKLAWMYTLLMELACICLFGAAAASMGTVAIFTGLGSRTTGNPAPALIMGLFLLTAAGTIYQAKRYQVLGAINRR